MCSVSFVPHTRGFYIGMNRDESLRRPTAHPPQILIRAGRAMLHPAEPAGGSWVGVNDTGLAVTLVNWYAVARLPGSGRVSRGIIVPSILKAAAFAEARDLLFSLPLHDVSPFRVIVFSRRERKAVEFRWDQHSLEEVRHAWEPRHWFSSGFDEARAQHERGQVARNAWRTPRAGSLPWLRRLHASHEPARGPFCFCMHRRDAATVSYTEIVVTRHAATMRYHAGSLCAVPQPTTTHTLSLQAACKEFAASPTNEDEIHQSSFQPSRRPLLSGGLSSRCEVRAVTC